MTRTPCREGKARLRATQAQQRLSGRMILGREKLPIVPMRFGESERIAAKAASLADYPADISAFADDPACKSEICFAVNNPELFSVDFWLNDFQLLLDACWPGTYHQVGDPFFGACIPSCSPTFFRFSSPCVSIECRCVQEDGVTACGSCGVLQWIPFEGNCNELDCPPDDNGCCNGCGGCMADCQDLINAINALTLTVDTMSLRLECLSQFIKQSQPDRDYTARHYQYQELAILRTGEQIAQAIVAGMQAVAEEQIPRWAPAERLISDTNTNFPLECDLNPPPPEPPEEPV